MRGKTSHRRSTWKRFGTTKRAARRNGFLNRAERLIRSAVRTVELLNAERHITHRPFECVSRDARVRESRDA